MNWEDVPWSSISNIIQWLCIFGLSYRISQLEKK